MGEYLKKYTNVTDGHVNIIMETGRAEGLINQIGNDHKSLIPRPVLRLKKGAGNYQLHKKILTIYGAPGMSRVSDLRIRSSLLLTIKY